MLKLGSCSLVLFLKRFDIWVCIKLPVVDDSLHVYRSQTMLQVNLILHLRFDCHCHMLRLLLVLDLGDLLVHVGVSQRFKLQLLQVDLPVELRRLRHWTHGLELVADV